MNVPISVSWRDAANHPHSAQWVTSALGARPPARIVTADDTLTADTAYRLACEGTALVWQGDYQNARQLLQAMARRVDAHRSRKRVKTPAPAVGDPALFHAYRQAQSARAKVLGMLWVPLTPDNAIALRRAPDVAQALEQAFGAGAGGDLRVVSLREVLGVVGAAQWRVRGVPVSGACAGCRCRYWGRMPGFIRTTGCSRRCAANTSSWWRMRRCLPKR